MDVLQAAAPSPIMDPNAVLASVFGHAGLRSGQAEAIAGLLAGRDVQVLLPTGGGKSLCFQLPAVVARRRGAGLTLVVSPLIALMHDQVSALKARGVAAAALHSMQDELEQREIVAHMLTGKLDLLYISPERAALPGFRRLLGRSKVALLAIDEAHCISQWGHDFRPEYMRLGELKRELRVPTIALTATATPVVMDEIGEKLGLLEPTVVRGSFTRDNLRFAVTHVRTDAQRLGLVTAAIERAGLPQADGRVIIYCATRKKVEAVAEHLKGRGLPVGYYHAGRTELQRRRAQERYHTGKTPILVATNAFGMGIDHPDVRLIVHFQAPASLEAYYQEAGRAGRDGAAAECHLLFGLSDLVTQRFLARKQGGDERAQGRRNTLLGHMEGYARSSRCRQVVIAEYFAGAVTGDCGACDSCAPRAGEPLAISSPLAPKRLERPAEPLPQASREVILRAAAGLRRPCGKIALARALRGSKERRLKRFGLLELPEHGALRAHSETDLLGAIDELLADGGLVTKGKKYPTVWLAGRPVRGRRDANAPARASRPHKPPLWRALDTYRRRTARALNWKTYMVFPNAVIALLVEHQPRSAWELQQIRGLGPAKIGRFGEDIVALVNEHGGGHDGQSFRDDGPTVVPLDDGPFIEPVDDDEILEDPVGSV
jgi:ATP-dependent DNA helicase RecQ